MRSGVGPARELRSLGISVVQDVPGVGQNLGDHPRVLVRLTLKPAAQATSPYDRTCHVCLRYTTGLAGAGRNDMLLFANTHRFGSGDCGLDQAGLTAAVMQPALYVRAPCRSRRAGPSGLSRDHGSRPDCFRGG